MNCPDCDSFTYQGMCSCGWKLPPINTIEIKRPDVVETNYPVQLDERTKNALGAVKLTGKEYAEYCIDYAKKILRGEII